mgnify:CR=1 FL=1
MEKCHIFIHEGQRKMPLCKQVYEFKGEIEL